MAILSLSGKKLDAKGKDISVARFPGDSSAQMWNNQDDLVLDLDPPVLAISFRILATSAQSGSELVRFFDCNGDEISTCDYSGFVGAVSTDVPIARVAIFEDANDGDDIIYNTFSFASSFSESTPGQRLTVLGTLADTDQCVRDFEIRAADCGDPQGTVKSSESFVGYNVGPTGTGEFTQDYHIDSMNCEVGIFNLQEQCENSGDGWNLVFKVPEFYSFQFTYPEDSMVKGEGSLNPGGLEEIPLTCDYCEDGFCYYISAECALPAGVVNDAPFGYSTYDLSEIHMEFSYNFDFICGKHKSSKSSKKSGKGTYSPGTYSPTSSSTSSSTIYSSSMCPLIAL